MKPHHAQRISKPPFASKGLDGTPWRETEDRRKVIGACTLNRLSQVWDSILQGFSLTKILVKAKALFFVDKKSFKKDLFFTIFLKLYAIF